MDWGNFPSIGGIHHTLDSTESCLLETVFTAGARKNISEEQQYFKLFSVIEYTQSPFLYRVITLPQAAPLTSQYTS